MVIKALGKLLISSVILTQQSDIRWKSWVAGGLWDLELNIITSRYGLRKIYVWSTPISHSRLHSRQTYKQEILFRSNNFFGINHAVGSKLHLVIEDHSQLNYCIEFYSGQHSCGFAQALSKLQIHFLQTQGMIMRTKSSGESWWHKVPLLGNGLPDSSKTRPLNSWQTLE